MSKRVWIAFSQVAIAGMLYSSQATALNPVLAAAFSITSTEYCVGQPDGIITEGKYSSVPRQPSDVVVLLLKGITKFRNASNEALILPPSYLARATITEIPKRHSPRRIRRDPPRMLDDLPDYAIPNSVYLPVIPPMNNQNGPKYDLIIRVYDPREPGLDLRGKKVRLQLEFASELSPKLASKLAERWRGYGFLWTGTLKAEPLEISVGALPEISHCSVGSTRID
jgi:hypothetical protein